MMGMILQALPEMLGAHFGTDVWERVRARAGLEEETFLSTDVYPDERFSVLLSAAAAELRLSPGVVAELAGEAFASGGMMRVFGPILRAAGDTFPEVLQNLGALHSRVGSSVGTPPELVCTRSGPGEAELRYRSSRTYMGPFLVGTLRGLGKRFGQDVDVEIRSAEVGSQLTVRWRPS